MVERAVLPDLLARSGEAATIRSRVLRTWGLAESTLAEKVAPRFDALAASGAPVTIAFLASGIEGIKVRITAKAAIEAEALAALADEEAALRALLGDIVFGVDTETMEAAVGEMLVARGLTPGLGRVAHRRTCRFALCGGARCVALVPRRDRVLCVRSEVLGARRARRTGRVGRRGHGDGSGRGQGVGTPMSGWPSPASRDRMNRTASPSARCSTASASTARPTPSRSGCRATASACVSSPRSR